MESFDSFLFFVQVSTLGYKTNHSLSKGVEKRGGRSYWWGMIINKSRMETYGASVWNGKPAAIISQSPGNLGAFGANHHLRQILTCLNMQVVQQPEAYIGNAAALLDENGKVKDQGTVQFLQSFVDAFVNLIKKY